ncbi:MAG: 4-hydroxy-tetrahydrodipicolinate synthase [Holosporales bacterium]|jgi:4-hydroxy-tetrahydrodipicolinate synthase|nr:4-hydroxy-tetrahydrodipicolinate synthase [Holosporales bacterium]
MNISGSFVALVSPFNNDTVDTKALQDLVLWHAENKTDGIVVAGSTGESFLLSEDERSSIIHAAVNASRSHSQIDKTTGHTPIFAGVSAIATRDAIRLAKEAEKCGADGIMLVTPCYIKPTQEGAVAFFKAVAEQVQLPIIVYNHPLRTGTNLQLKTLIEICEAAQNIVAIKDSSNNLESISLLRQQLPERVSLFSGDDGTNIGFLAQGGSGIISVTANIYPNLCKLLVKSWKEGDCKKAFDIHLSLSQVNKAMFCEPNPCPVKFALFKKGKIKNEVRKPLLPVKDGSPSAQMIMDSMALVKE